MTAAAAATMSRPRYAPDAYLHRVVPGFTRLKLAEFFAERGYTVGAEIGVADGRFSLVLCQTIPHLRLFCIDPWRPYPENPRGGSVVRHERNYALARERLAPYAVLFWRMMSLEAAAEIPDGTLDFCFVDGNHEKDYVLADLRAWSPKVRRGGIVAGHDFYFFPRRPAGVVEAVVQFTEEHSIEDWHLCDEREPSYWWVKS
jgi:hypothetical protein